MAISIVQMFENANAYTPPPPTPNQERAMAAVALMTVVPTDRALAGWCTFGENQLIWADYATATGARVMDVVSGYVWA